MNDKNILPIENNCELRKRGLCLNQKQWQSAPKPVCKECGGSGEVLIYENCTECPFRSEECIGRDCPIVPCPTCNPQPEQNMLTKPENIDISKENVDGVKVLEKPDSGEKVEIPCPICGGKLDCVNTASRFTGELLVRFTCINEACKFYSFNIMTENKAEAIAAFRLATRADLCEHQAAEIEKLIKHTKSVEFDLKCIRNIRKLRDIEIEVQCKEISDLKAENQRLRGAGELTLTALEEVIQVLMPYGTLSQQKVLRDKLSECKQALKGEEQ